MASIRTLHLPHYEAYPVHVALFEDVQNADFLKSQLLAANPEFDYAFLDASMILSQTHILTTTALTLHSFLSPSTSPPKTRSPHSELVFRLSPNNNIGQAYTLFGITPSTTALVVLKLAVKVGGDGRLDVDQSVTAESVGAHLGRVVQGRCVPVVSRGAEELGAKCDVQRVRKVYKLGDLGGKERDERMELESVVLGIMSLKGS
ncbi:hypothetical protein T440DRAFT_553349 [Plenodomus tracheiphilus IPT5]|uniref:EKC/KEOPS complex subunit CGI121 n=1 Tax=Plenodomus tracheiphilus IPT5 TaxID=1408161 RepID=A0A6A7BE35_9PLEO|nr:hypothetical protein T440DRAFT_553349 [Plenodomus tracheiphilus IPT5]